MKASRILVPMTVLTLASSTLAAPQLPGVGAAMQRMVDAQEIAGAVTLVTTKDKILHLETTGFANLETKQPLQPDMIAWIASMTKPTTGVAILMLQDEG